MYTISVLLLVCISACLLIYDFKTFKNKVFIYWFLITCIWGWVEFITMLRFTPPAWFFNPKHVIGFKILNTELEDYLFCIGISVIFYWIYQKLKPLFKIKEYNPDSKLIVMAILSVVSLVYWAIGSQFASYLAIKQFLGIAVIISLYNKLSFRHMLAFSFTIFAIGLFWDIIAINLGHWFYVTETGEMCHVYSELTYKILKAVFPIEIFYYYVSGALFCFGVLAFLENYFSKQKRL